MKRTDSHMAKGGIMNLREYNEVMKVAESAIFYGFETLPLNESMPFLERCIENLVMAEKDGVLGKVGERRLNDLKRLECLLRGSA